MRPARSSHCRYERPSLVSARVRWLIGAALAAGVGTALTAWMLADRRSGARVAERLGMRRLADRWDDIVSILALPALMFCLILCVWATGELVRAYRSANDPERFRRARSRGMRSRGG